MGAVALCFSLDVLEGGFKLVKVDGADEMALQ